MADTLTEIRISDVISISAVIKKPLNRYTWPWRCGLATRFSFSASDIINRSDMLFQYIIKVYSLKMHKTLQFAKELHRTIARDNMEQPQQDHADLLFNHLKD